LFVLGLTEILEPLRYDGDVFGMLPALLKNGWRWYNDIHMRRIGMTQDPEK
jgi:hypothetical protein